MWENIIPIFLISIIALIPIVLWGYIFSYIDNSHLSRKRFIMGLIGWSLSVIPILFLEKLLESPWFSFLNIFEKITQTSTLFGIINFSMSLILFLFLIVGIAFISTSWTTRNRKMLKIYIRNIIHFSLFIWIISVIIFFFSYIGVGSHSIENSENFGDITFNTLKLIFFYYILIAFIEESSKHFNFLQSSVLYVKTIQNGVLYAIFVALGFAFIENILYIYSDFSQWGMSQLVASTFFYRSVFSVMVHVLCSAIVWYAFSKAYLENMNKILSFNYMKIFFSWLFVWILLHLIFDISLNFGLSFIIMVYFIWGYLYVSSIFYRE